MRALPFGRKVGATNVAMLAATFAWLGCWGSGCGGGGGSSGSAGSPGSAGSSGSAGSGAAGTAGTTGTGGATGDAGASGGAGTTGSGGAGTTGGGGQGGLAGAGGSASGGSSGGAGAGGVTGAGGSAAAGRGGAGGPAGAGGGAGSTGRGGAGAAAGATGSAGRGGAGGTGGASGTTGAGGGATNVTWTTRTLSTQHTAEGADVGDINGDGVLDLIAGPTWYAGPSFSVGGTVMANPPTFTMNEYSTFFLTLVDDVNDDSRPDVIAVGDAGGGNGSGNPNAFWYANPGPANLTQPWTKTAIFNGLVANESPAYLNVTGDAKKELVFMTSNQLGFARPGATPTAAWTFTAISGSTSFGTPYVHGLGVGDVDGDGMPDIVERSGWWRQIAGATWERHAFDFWLGSTSGRSSNWGGSEIYVYDVDGDGDNDVVTVLAAHQYGLAWFERQGTGTSATFVAHQILPTTASSSNLSQMHAVAVADVNGDGLLDIVTGKRYYAHPSTNADPGTTDPAIVAWFELQRGAGGATFVQHVIHMASGVGCNFVARDVTGDGKVDIFSTNKHGTFLHVQN